MIEYCLIYRKDPRDALEIHVLESCPCEFEWNITKVLNVWTLVPWISYMIYMGRKTSDNHFMALIVVTKCCCDNFQVQLRAPPEGEPSFFHGLGYSCPCQLGSVNGVLTNPHYCVAKWVTLSFSLHPLWGIDRFDMFWPIPRKKLAGYRHEAFQSKITTSAQVSIAFGLLV